MNAPSCLPLHLPSISPPSIHTQSRLFPGRSLPASLLHTLTPLVVVPPAARDVALMARRLLTAMLPAIGGPLRDDKQAVHLAQLARALLLGSPTTPPDHLGVPAADELLSPEEFEMAAKYMEVVVGCGSPMALLAAAHVALEAAGGVAKTGKGTATPVFSVRGGAATLQLCAVVAQQLGAASNCPQLGDRCKVGRFLEGGQDWRLGVCLVAVRGQGAGCGWAVVGGLSYCHRRTVAAIAHATAIHACVCPHHTHPMWTAPRTLLVPPTHTVCA